MQRVIPFLAAGLMLFFFGAQKAHAIPVLQLYLEGGTYDPVLESWVLKPEGSSSGAPFRVWVLGNVDGPGGDGPIKDVRMAIAYDKDTAKDLILSVTGSQAGGVGVGHFQGVDDPSIAPDPITQSLVQTYLDGEIVTVDTSTTDGEVLNGGRPVLSDGKPLAPHGVFGANTIWREFMLGDFTLTDSHIGDFIGSFPEEVDLFENAGQINVYEVSALNFSGGTLYFNAYNSVEVGNSKKTKAVFAPFSHNAAGEAHIIPEPSAVLIWLLIGVCCGTVGLWRKRRGAVM